ncbi:MarR family transcriptional regulator [Actinorhabdospora filicis]|uniref:MarR family transcriptional regulator n=1 Tax=Actinorhabdospora filicis TaxID=1785913 RepID=A0A9W6SPJ6_9ACTN|nr:MarR family transcriptional regulator [Actinorhabdospora filicis]GLZ79831.1 MarR family transcriptional regulator [Actinorhabdospora filicis]
MIDREAVGTLLRHVHDVLDGDVARAQAALGLPEDYRPRFSPVLRALARGPLPIRDLAAAIGVTHSAASQTVAQLTERDLVELRPGDDARQRIAHLTPRAEALLPAVEREWRVVSEAMAELDAELPAPLAEVLLAVLAAVERKPFRERVLERA